MSMREAGCAACRRACSGSASRASSASRSRCRRATASGLGGVHRGRREVWHHAVRHRGDARAREKGYIIAGQDTDGTVTPHDLGMDWIVAQKKPDFIGKRSLARADIQPAASSWSGSARPRERAARGRRADRRRPASVDPHDHDRARHLELHEPQSRPLRARAGQGRPRAHRRAAVRADARPHHRRDRDRAGVSTRRSGCVPEALRHGLRSSGGPAAARGPPRRAHRAGQIDLRGDPHARGFMAAVGRALDLCCRASPAPRRQDQISALWLGPDQWLVTCPGRDVPGLLASLRAALAGVHAAITDVTDGSRVPGRRPERARCARQGLPLDLHARISPGRCAQSLLAKASVLIHLVDDGPEQGPSFDVYVARSFADYLWTWLEDAGREYGVRSSR